MNQKTTISVEVEFLKAFGIRGAEIILTHRRQNLSKLDLHRSGEFLKTLNKHITS